MSDQPNTGECGGPENHWTGRRLIASTCVHDAPLRVECGTCEHEAYIAFGHPDIDLHGESASERAVEVLTRMLAATVPSASPERCLRGANAVLNRLTEHGLAVVLAGSSTGGTDA